MIFTLATVFVACGNDTPPAETTPATTTTTDPFKGITVPREPAGTEDDPILIKDADDLKGMVKKVSSSDYAGKIFKLTADIQLNDTSVDGWYEKEDAYVWPMLDNFSGVIDGDGHTIEGILIAGVMKKGGINFGFLRHATGATLKNINFYNGYVKVPNDPNNGGMDTAENAPSAGFLCGGGGGDGLTVENCIVNVTFDCPQAYGVAPIGYMGGKLVVKNTLIVPVFASKANGYGSIASGAADMEVNNVFVASTTHGVHWTNKWTTTNVYKLGDNYERYNGTMKGVGEISSVLGDAAKTKLEGFDFENVWATVTSGGTGYMPVPKVFANIPQQYLPTL